MRSSFKNISSLLRGTPGERAEVKTQSFQAIQPLTPRPPLPEDGARGSKSIFIASKEFLFLTMVMFMSGCQSKAEDERGRLIAVLEREMSEQTEFVKVHAAEALVSHGYRELVNKHFEPELATATIPYSVGVHRVLARVAVNAESRALHVEAIRQVAFDRESMFRVHAIESLAKLGEYRSEDRLELERFISESDDGSSAFAIWLLALSEDSHDQERLVRLLRSVEPMARLRASYALSRTAKVAESTKKLLIDTLDSEPRDSIARVYLLSAVLRHSASSDRKNRNVASEIEKYLHSEKANESFHAAMSLGLYGDASMIPVLSPNLKSIEPDARIGAADGVLHLLSKGVSL